MAYMSYCRFEGTSNELRACINDLYDCGDLSDSESNYAARLRDLCEEYIDAYEEWLEQKELEKEDGEVYP